MAPQAKHQKNTTEAQGIRNIKLSVTEGVNKGKRYKLGGRRIILGRSPDCDIELINSKISKRQAKIEIREDQVELSDLDSSNGTFVNGMRITRTFLSPGDKISLGGVCEMIITGDFVKPGRQEENASIKKEETFGSPLLLAQQMDQKNEEEAASLQEIKKQKQKMKGKKISRWKILIGIFLIFGGVGYLIMDSLVEVGSVFNKISTSIKEQIALLPFVEPVVKKDLESSVDFKRPEPSMITNEARREAQRLYKHAYHMYLSNRFHESIRLFKEVLLFNRNHKMAQLYLERAESDMKTLVDLHDKEGRQLFNNLRYYEAMISFRNVVHLLADEPSDPRYKEAKAYIKECQKKLKRD